MKKTLLAVSLILLSLLLLVSCGKPAETETGETACSHPDGFVTVQRKEPTCMEIGHLQEKCMLCGQILSAELTVVDHSYEEVELGISGITREQCVYCGEMPKKSGAILLEVQKTKSGAPYSSLNIYVQNSDSSGDYYTCYHMNHVYSDVRNNYKVNSASNVNNYRIVEADVVKVTAVEDSRVVSQRVAKVLSAGEISFAVRQMNLQTDWLTKEAKEAIAADAQYPADFIGGYHGDEWIESVSLFADGEEVALAGVTEATVIPCSELKFDQLTTIYAWGTSNADSHGVAVAEHSQSFTVDSNGIHNSQSVKWLRDDFEFDPTKCYFLMFPMMRLHSNLTVSSSFECYDANGELLTIEEVPEGPITAQQNISFDTETRKIYMSSLDGFFGEVDFSFPDDTLFVKNMYMAIRVDGIGDNKFYTAVQSVQNANMPKSGEVFAIDVSYSIDYANPAK